MLVAFDKSEARRLAFQTDKSDGPFLCPCCKEEVILKKGKIKEHHFAHKPPVACQYGKGETELHYKAKREIYQALVEHPNCSKCELERPLKDVRPDISLYIGNTPVAVEIQNSNIPIEEITRRTIAYAGKGIYIVWIIPDKEPDYSLDDDEKMITRIKEWHKFLQAMFFGRLYYWTHNGYYVTPMRLETYSQITKSGNWVEDYEDSIGEDLSGTDWYSENYDYADYGGNTIYYKSTKEIIKNPRGKLSLVDDFMATSKTKKFETKNWTVPACRLWMDNLKKWW